MTRNVDKLSCVRFASARYSAPNRLIGTTVRIVQDGGWLLIVEPATGEVVASPTTSWRRPARPACSTPITAVPAPHPTADPDRKRPWRNSSAPWVNRPRSSAAAGNTRLAGELEILLALGAAHGQQPLIDALTRAVAFKRFRADDVRSILAAGTSPPTPVPAGGALVLDLPAGPPAAPSLDAYRLDEVTGTTADPTSRSRRRQPPNCPRT